MKLSFSTGGWPFSLDECASLAKEMRYDGLEISAEMGDNMCMKQLSFLPEENIDPRPPMSVNRNLWHGCTRASTGCLHCYMYRRDESIDKDPSIVTKTDSFNLPVRISTRSALKTG